MNTNPPRSVRPVIAVAMLLALAGMVPVSAQQPAAQQPQIRVTGLDINTGLRSPTFDAYDRQRPARQFQWVQIMAEFETRGGEEGWIDNLTFDWHVLLIDGRVPRLLFTESVTYMDVQSGETHNAVVYIRPRPILRYYHDRGRITRRNILVHMNVKVGNFVIGSFSFPEAPPDPIPPRWWENPRVNLVQGALVSRDKTPFAHVNFDFYPYIRPAAAR